MTPEEAILRIKAHMEVHKLREPQAAYITEALNMAMTTLKEIQQYREIGTVEECREAVEKQKPMKVKEVHVDEYYCPACGSENCCDQGIVGDRYCPYCGHAIDENLEGMEDDA